MNRGKDETNLRQHKIDRANGDQLKTIMRVFGKTRSTPGGCHIIRKTHWRKSRSGAQQDTQCLNPPLQPARVDSITAYRNMKMELQNPFCASTASSPRRRGHSFGAARRLPSPQMTSGFGLSRHSAPREAEG